MCGLNPVGGGRGVVDIQENPHSIGLEVWIRLEAGGRKFSLDSHIKTRSLNDLRTKESHTHLSMCYGTEDSQRTLTGGELRMVLGNAQWWG